VNDKILVSVEIGTKGGAGSGNWGHTGRPGLVGGSGGRASAFTPGMAGTKREDARANEYLNDGLPGTGGWKLAHANTRGRIKQDIIQDLAADTGLPEEDINAVVSQWARTSNDADMQSLSLQQAAAEELGLSLSEWQVQRLATVPSGRPLLPRNQERAIIRAMYDRTQEDLKMAGYEPNDTVTLCRGVKSDAHVYNLGTSSYNGNAIESWSTSAWAAGKFAGAEDSPSARTKYGAVLSIEVPIGNIISTCRTGFGCLTEGEFVIAGNIPGSEVYVSKVFEPKR